MARPDVTPVQVCRQTMRRLRIEFGHKMVERKELIQVREVSIGVVVPVTCCVVSLQDGDVEELKLVR